MVQAVCSCWLVPFEELWVYATSVPVFLLAFLFIFQWHWRDAFRDFPWASKLNEIFGKPHKNTRTLAVDLLIVNFYYNEHMKDTYFGKQRFTTSFYMIFFDNVILFFMMLWIADHMRGQPAPAVEFDPFDMDIRVTHEDPRSDSVYQDLIRPFQSTLALFIMQTGLFSLYVAHMNMHDDEDEPVAFYWFLAIMIQLYAGETQLGTSYFSGWWTALFQFDSDIVFEPSTNRSATLQSFLNLPLAPSRLSKTKRKVFFVLPISFGMEWRSRQFMDWFVNSVIREALKYTFPILVCTEEPLDFVKDCMAIFFLTTLDDLTPDFVLTITEIRALLKFNMLYYKETATLLPGTLQEVFQRRNVVDANQESLLGIGDALLSDREEAAVYEGLKKCEKTTFVRISNDRFHMTIFNKLFRPGQTRDLVEALIAE
eukprot:CAMPEP_0194482464 /NCGR_PEP_ID=MMETSP0253-20130528/4401_1 /TAXON_ID=2966 /ORGANISM="Noctiluca scintillans" /LENGTH=425 /DNA_ID=CAMNT_0039322005 /DNA_START=66 /DNA_END=1343 /DNA_ORIENTATION=-